jgi:hypothetical protein
LVDNGTTPTFGMSAYVVAIGGKPDMPLQRGIGRF